MKRKALNLFITLQNKSPYVYFLKMEMSEKKFSFVDADGKCILALFQKLASFPCRVRFMSP